MWSVPRAQSGVVGSSSFANDYIIYKSNKDVSAVLPVSLPHKQEHTWTKLKTPGATYIPNPIPAVSQIACKIKAMKQTSVAGSVKIHHYEWENIC